LKVWGLPVLSEEEIIALHTDLVAAAMSIEGLKFKGEDDLFIFFSADLMKYGLGSEILIEYKDVADHWARGAKTLVLLATKLGNVAKKHFPRAFVQSEVTTVDGESRHYWTSEQSGTREEVERIRTAAEEKLPRLIKEAEDDCYCEANAADHKGACHHCNNVATHNHIVKEGQRILAITDPGEFQAEADVYVAHAPESL
jgi:hypothetical protein